MKFFEMNEWKMKYAIFSVKRKTRSLIILAVLKKEQSKELEMCLPKSLKKWKKKKGIEVAEDNPESQCNDQNVEKIKPDVSDGTGNDGSEMELAFHSESDFANFPEKKLELGTALRLREPVSETNDFSLSQETDRSYWDTLDKKLKKDKLLSKFPRVCIIYWVSIFATFNYVKGTLPSDFDQTFQNAKKKFAEKYLLHESMDHLSTKVK